MSNIEKVASMSPLEIFLTTGALGAGGYGTLQLLKDLLAGKQQPQLPGQAIAVRVPDRKPKEEAPTHMVANDIVEPMGMSSVKHAEEPNALMQFLTQPTDRLSGVVTGLLGLPLGVMGTKGLYDHLQANKLEAKLEAEKKRYEEALYRAKYGEASTPALDDFCEKTATWFDRGLDPDAVEKFHKTIPHENPFKSALKHLSPSTHDAGEAIKDTWWTAAALTSALTMAALAAQRRNKEKKEKRIGYPTRVVLE